jgi:hypothetical protein
MPALKVFLIKEQTDLGSEVFGDQRTEGKSKKKNNFDEYYLINRLCHRIPITTTFGNFVVSFFRHWTKINN